MKPYVVRRVTAPDGQLLFEQQPKALGRPIRTETAREMTRLLARVTEEGGTGFKARVEGYSVAGKTGTAQIPSKEGGYLEDETIQSFMGYFPAMNPRVLIFIKLDNPKGVGTSEYSAAPLFRKLAKYIIDLWQIPPDY